jgi:23S rRNA pseudouridine1911/1915/1917 synthase
MIEYSLDVLYEDNHLIIVNKPAGLLSQPTDLESDSMETRVKAWIKEKYHKPGNVFVSVVHRLDKPVSGILVLAKTSKALSRLNESMRSKHMQKTYLAFVEGIPHKKQDTLTHYLVHGDHYSLISNQKDKQAKMACLHYDTLETRQNSTLMQIILETGRYHQIRCQLAAIHHPVIGDLRYHAQKDQKFLKELPPNAIALHHFRLKLEHPVTKAELLIEAPPPEYMPNLERPNSGKCMEKFSN